MKAYLFIVLATFVGNVGAHACGSYASIGYSELGNSADYFTNATVGSVSNVYSANDYRVYFKSFTFKGVTYTCRELFINTTDTVHKASVMKMVMLALALGYQIDGYLDPWQPSASRLNSMTIKKP